MAGLITRTDMVTEILDNLSRGTSGQTRNGVVISNRAVTWLDRAQQWAARESAIRGIYLLTDIATASTVVSQKDYTFPSNVLAVMSLRLEDGLNSRKLTPVMPWDFDRIVPNPSTDTTGVPDWYIPYRASNTFELYRIPDAIYVMRQRYAYWPAALTSDSQLSDLSRMDDVIIFKATEYGFRWLQELIDAREWKDDAKEELGKVLEAEDMKYPDWEPVMTGFTSQPLEVVGEYWNSPFNLNSPGVMYWW